MEVVIETDQEVAVGLGIEVMVEMAIEVPEKTKKGSFKRHHPSAPQPPWLHGGRWDGRLVTLGHHYTNLRGQTGG